MGAALKENGHRGTAVLKGGDSPRPFSRSALWQVPAIVAIAMLLALVVNGLRTDGIPLVGEWSGETAPSATGDDSGLVSLAEAQRLFEAGGALFLDARSPADFAAGHIQGAVNLPWQQVDERFIEAAERIDSADRVIAYCDGEACELSHLLAGFLREMEYPRVRVLHNGFTVWRQAGLPVGAR
jgi:rhodanese-related sulfurtransferase